MKKTLFAFSMAIMATISIAQLNMTLLDAVNYGVNANDIWGWVDPDDGTEYALVGLRNGFSIVDLTNPTDVQEIQFIPGANSTWRDVKTWGNHIYVTNETANGVLVVDMTNAPDNITWFDWTPTIPGLGTLSTCHNLYIDEFGYCYLAGCNLNSGGNLIIDVFSDPGNPQFVAATPPVYAHDAYARNNLLYASQIYAGTLGIYDVSDKQNITLVASQLTPSAFTHNAWLNDAGDVVFTTDEKANAPIGAYDISDLSDIVELDQFRPVATLGEGVIPHNVHVWQDWLIISYYTDGGIIADASRPDNIIEVGNWDTFLGGNGGFSGAWGAYPFLPSGLVLLTDIGTGLYVCGADYVRACWLEGRVTNLFTGAPITGAKVVIDSPQANLGTSDLTGNYKTGQAIPGTFDVTFSALGYYPKTVQATLENGVLTILDVQLEPITSVTIPGTTVLQADASPVGGALVFLDGDIDYTFYSDANGVFSLENVTLGTYTIYAGGWGYLLEIIPNVVVNDQSGPITIGLRQGYQDDFAIDLGWVATGDAQSGLWERGEPVGTTNNQNQSNPEFDLPNDFGDQCYVTGNGGGSAADDDVDNGTVTLTSPPMDLTGYADPVISYYTWFYNAGGNGAPNDNLTVKINNGTDEVELQKISNSLSAWRPVSTFHLTDYIGITDNMRVIFETSDFPTSGHLVEAAVDGFLVIDSSPYPVFGASQTSGCSPELIEFSDDSDSTAIWAWTFEGGTPATSTEQNPVVSYQTPGVYDVTLQVTTNSGHTYTIVRPNFVNITETPLAAFAANVTGGNATFANNSTGGGTYQWAFGDGSTSTAATPAHSYTATGIYTVTLTVTNPCGTSTISQDVEILAIQPVASFGVSDMMGCTPFTVQFTDQSSGSPNTWAWSFIGGTPATSTEQNPVVTYNNPGIWAVQLTVGNAAGTNSVQQQQLITVAASPTADFTFNVNGPQAAFVNASTNANTYLWNFGDGTTSTVANPSHTFPGIGEYEVTLSVTNDCGVVALTQTVVVTSATAVADLDESTYRIGVAPNPFHRDFSLDYDLQGSFDQAHILVFNVLGEQVAARPLTGTRGKIAMGNEMPQSGTYFLRLVVDGAMGKAVRVVKM